MPGGPVRRDPLISLSEAKGDEVLFRTGSRLVTVLRRLRKPGATQVDTAYVLHRAAAYP